MSAILAVLAPSADALPSNTVVQRMHAKMSERGTTRAELWRSGRALLAVARGTWELEPGFSGNVLVAAHEGIVGAVDATLYYRDDLRGALAKRGIAPVSDAPAHLVIAAYRAWGEACAEHLEGDFAFIIWDSSSSRLVAARDFGGKRPLFHASIGGALVVSSSVDAITAYPGCSTGLNYVVIAEEAAAMTGSPDETCRRAVSRLPAGCTLSAKSCEPTRTRRHWRPPHFRDYGAVDAESAAEELRALLARAVEERLAPRGPTALFLSGGYDSPAVFATASAAVQRAADARTIVPISISYPSGDSGREDELIAAIVHHVGISTRWLPIVSVPPAAELAEGAARRAEAAFHPFELPDRALAMAASDAGARVTLDGEGGDYLFAASHAHLSDLFFAGHWISLMREWHAEGGAGYRAFLQHAVRPGLNPRTLKWVGRLARGRAIACGNPLRRTPPRWISRSCTKAFDLVEREAAHVPDRTRMSLSAYEAYWQLTNPATPKYAGMLAAIMLQHGLEHRSPLYDRRIVEFAASRPVRDRRSGGSTKVLLRRSMEPLLPHAVLKPRTHRTGVPRDYIADVVRKLLRGELRDIARQPLLADLGIVDGDAFRRAVHDIFASGSTGREIPLLFTIQVELWARGHAETRVWADRAVQRATVIA